MGRGKLGHGWYGVGTPGNGPLHYLPDRGQDDGEGGSVPAAKEKAGHLGFIICSSECFCIAALVFGKLSRGAEISKSVVADHRLNERL